MTAAEFDLWAEYVERRSGLCVRGRPAALARAVADRARATGTATATDYYVRVAAEADDREWGRLFGLLLNGETSFFRDPGLFDALTSDVLPELVRRDGPLRLWSAGCSGGQEAYSLAMAALDAGAAADRVAVRATDIRAECLDAVRRGEYPAAEVDRLPDALRRRYFARHGNVCRVAEAVARCVTAAPLDLLAEGYDVPPHDVILCQNVLFYYAPAARQAVARRLGERLTAGGLLFLGAAEGIGFRAPGLCPVRVGEAWAHRRP